MNGFNDLIKLGLFRCHTLLDPESRSMLAFRLNEREENNEDCRQLKSECRERVDNLYCSLI